MSRWGMHGDERRGYEDHEKADRWTSYPYSETYEYRQGWDEQARDERRERDRQQEERAQQEAQERAEEQRQHEARLEQQRQEEAHYQQMIDEQAQQEQQPPESPPTP